MWGGGRGGIMVRIWGQGQICDEVAGAEPEGWFQCGSGPSSLADPGAGLGVIDKP